MALTMDVGWLTDMLDAVDAHKQRLDAANQVMDLIIKGATIKAKTGSVPIKIMLGRWP